MKPFLLAAAAMALLAPAMSSAQDAAYYVATPVAAPAQASVVTRSTVWRARGPMLFAARAPERPLVLCRLLAARTGEIAAFATGGKPLDADELAECNARAAPQAVAAK